MRARIAIIIATGCYSPHPQAGAPCDPAQPSCPGGQQCVAEGGGHFCETHAIIDALPPDAAIDAPPDAQSAFGYTATVAECIDPMAPNPAMCTSIKGAAQLVVDMLDATTLQPWDAFLRFDLDGAFAGRSVVMVRLELTATDDTNAPSGNSGELYQVMPFTKLDLSLAEPAKVSATALAPNQGAVAKLQLVMWPVPTSLVAPNGSVFLELESTSQDGVNYWNLAGATPPRLVVYVQ